MAKRRMFSMDIVCSDDFLDMSVSARELYFQLGMYADDDGFITPKRIMRMVGASIDDLKILLSKRFLLDAGDGVVVIKHWRSNNYIQKDRKQVTRHSDRKNMLYFNNNGDYTDRVTNKPIGDLVEVKETKPLTGARKLRYEAKKDSDLPYSFEYKIRNEFSGEKCPICDLTMDNARSQYKPSIQHNTPISLGGSHDINNISVICRSCNSSLNNRTITEGFNTDKVKEVWERIGNGAGMDTQVRLGKVRLGNKETNVSDEMQSIYDLFIKSFNKNENTYKLSPARKAKLKVRLKDAGKEMIEKAIKNVANSPFHMGDNDRGWTADLDYIIRNYEQVEKLAAMGDKSSVEGKNPNDVVDETWEYML